MRYSHKHKFIILSNWKAACSTLAQLFTPFSEFDWDSRGKCKQELGVEYLKVMHEKATTIKHLFAARGYDYHQYTTIITIRNPWERVVSLYNYLHKNGNFYAQGSFESFVKKGLRAFMAANNCYTTYEMVHDSGQRIVDYIVKLEDLQSELAQIVNKHFDFQLDTSTIPTLNACSHAAYQTFYSSETRDIIGEMFAYDIEIGGYEFEELDYNATNIFSDLRARFLEKYWYPGHDLHHVADHYFSKFS